MSEQDVADEVIFRQIDEDMLTECQGRLEVLEEQNRNLKIAMQSARRIGAAVGILMSTQHVTDDAAFEALRKASQHSQRKLRDIADDVVLTGELPERRRPGV